MSKKNVERVKREPKGTQNFRINVSLDVEFKKKCKEIGSAPKFVKKELLEEAMRLWLEKRKEQQVQPEGKDKNDEY